MAGMPVGHRAGVKTTDVVIVGGSISGISAAYFLGQAGVQSVVVEPDGVGSHASGFAYGMLGALRGAGTHGPTSALAAEGMRLHRKLSQSLSSETGIDIEYRRLSALSLAFNDDEVEAAKTSLVSQQQQGNGARWIDAGDLSSIDARISNAALGGVQVDGTSDVQPHDLVLALAQGSKRLGSTVRHGRVTGLTRDRGEVRAVAVEQDEISCRAVVLAMGPWSGEASAWLGVPIDVRPLKGQILHLRAPGPPYRCAISWSGNYATTKPDGLVWVGTTEEEVGFDEQPTDEARDQIMAKAVKMLPSLADAELVRQTACLRPVSADRLPVLGRVPDWEGVYIATGGGRQGIVLGPAMGRITADLITDGTTNIPIDAFDPGRFAR